VKKRKIRGKGGEKDRGNGSSTTTLSEVPFRHKKENRVYERRFKGKGITKFTNSTRGSYQRVQPSINKRGKKKLHVKQRAKGCSTYGGALNKNIIHFGCPASP